MGKMIIVLALVAMTASCAHCGALDVVMPALAILRKIPVGVSGAGQNDHQQSGNLQLGGDNEFNRTSVIKKEPASVGPIARQGESVLETNGKVGGNLKLSESTRGRHSVNGTSGLEGSGEAGGQLEAGGNVEINGKGNSTSDTTLKGLGGSQVNVKSNGQSKGRFTFQSGFTGSGSGAGAGKVEPSLPLKLLGAAL